MSVKFSLSPTPLDFDRLFATTAFSMTKDWDGAPLAHVVDFYLAADPHSIFFGAEVAGTPLTLESRPGFGEYVEGLWKADVIELFVFDTASTRYQEFNLSSSGAWWSMGFRNYREREPKFSRPLGTQQQTAAHGDKWRVAMSVPLAELWMASADWPNLLANLCAISGKQFVSFAAPTSAVPDFHRPRIEFCGR